MDKELAVQLDEMCNQLNSKNVLVDNFKGLTEVLVNDIHNSSFVH